MNTLLDRPAFSVGSQTYTWADVVLSAHLRGEWAQLEEQTRLGMNLVHRAEEDESPSEEEIEAAGEEFRYARDLVTAEEMEAWLGRFDLTVESWTDYLERSILRQGWEGSRE